MFLSLIVFEKTQKQSVNLKKGYFSNLHIWPLKKKSDNNVTTYENVLQ